MVVAPLLPWNRAVTRTRYGNSVQVYSQCSVCFHPFQQGARLGRPGRQHVQRGRSSSTMDGATPERDESELLASQLNEAAVVAETEFDAQATLDDVQSRNPHLSLIHI